MFILKKLILLTIISTSYITHSNEPVVLNVDPELFNKGEFFIELPLELSGVDLQSCDNLLVNLNPTNKSGRMNLTSTINKMRFKQKSTKVKAKKIVFQSKVKISFSPNVSNTSKIHSFDFKITFLDIEVVIEKVKAQLSKFKGYEARIDQIGIFPERELVLFGQAKINFEENEENPLQLISLDKSRVASFLKNEFGSLYLSPIKAVSLEAGQRGLFSGIIEAGALAVAEKVANGPDFHKKLWKSLGSNLVDALDDEIRAQIRKVVFGILPSN